MTLAMREPTLRLGTLFGRARQQGFVLGCIVQRGRKNLGPLSSVMMLNVAVDSRTAGLLTRWRHDGRTLSD